MKKEKKIAHWPIDSCFPFPFFSFGDKIDIENGNVPNVEMKCKISKSRRATYVSFDNTTDNTYIQSYNESRTTSKCLR